MFATGWPYPNQLQRAGLKSGDVVDVAFPDLGRGVALVFVKSPLEIPAGELANDSDDASGAMLTMVAVDDKRVVLTVENNLQNRRHGAWGNWLFLCTLHVEDDLLNAVGGDKSLELMVRLIFFYERAVAWSALRAEYLREWQYVHNRLELQALQEGEILFLGIAASVHTRDDQPKIDRSALYGSQRDVGCM